jgi:hypothetical protein
VSRDFANTREVVGFKFDKESLPFDNLVLRSMRKIAFSVENEMVETYKFLVPQ